MVVFNVFPQMSTSIPTTNNNNSNKSSTIPNSTSSEFSKEQWLQLLRILPPNSLVNLQVAWKEYIEETSRNQQLQQQQQQSISLPDASTLVPLVGAAQNQDQLTQNAYEKLIKQQLDLNNSNNSNNKSVEQPNGLDALAAAALANTSTEVRISR